MANLLKNAGFNETPSDPTTLSGSQVGGQSAAPSWGTWNNNGPLTTTDVLHSSRGSHEGSMLHVDSLGPHNGIYQVFGKVNTGPARTRSSVWVYVLRGTVGMGTGNGGNTPDTDARSTTRGRWEQLSAPNGVSPANEIVIYAVSPDGACFYVDDASVEAVIAPTDAQGTSAEPVGTGAA